MEDQPHHPFDPAVLKRLTAATTAAKLSGSTFASPRTTDLEQLLERDAYAEQTRHQLAEKCAIYRSQRDEAYSSIWLIAQSLASLAAFQLAANPDDSAWNIVNTSAQQLLTAHAPQERPASAPATVETKPTPNRPQTTVPPLEAAGIFFPGSTPSAIPAEPTDQLVHMWARDENDNPTGYALCDTGDGAHTTIDGKIANSTWQVNCPKCEEIRDRGAEQHLEQDAQGAEYEKWRESEDSAGRGDEEA